MKIYYKPRQWAVSNVTDGTPWTTRGLSGTVQIGVQSGSAQNAIGDAWCLHHLAGTLGLPVSGSFQANYDNQFAELNREPVEKDIMYSFKEESDFFISSHEYEVKQALSNNWGDAYNSKHYLKLRGHVPRVGRGSMLSDNYAKLLWSPVMVIEDCDGNFFRVNKGDSSVSVSATNPDFVFLELKVSSDFKFLAVD